MRGSQREHGHGCGCTRDAINPSCLTGRASRLERMELLALEKLSAVAFVGFAMGPVASAVHPGVGALGCLALAGAILGWRFARKR